MYNCSVKLGERLGLVIFFCKSFCRNNECLNNFCYNEGESLESMDFNMRVIRYIKTAFARQIQEAVEIQTNIL